MRFALDADQRMLRDTVRAFLSEHCPMAKVRQVVDTAAGHDSVLWKRMAVELGLQGIAIPARFGGSGGGWVELGVVLREQGYALLPGPFFSTVVLGANTVLLSDDVEACEEWLPLLAEGEIVATVAFCENNRWDLAEPRTRALCAGGGWTLNGVKTLVSDGADADLIIVSAHTEVGSSLFVVTGDAPGLDRIALDSFDLTRRYADLAFRDTPATLLGTAGHGSRVLQRVLDVAAIGLACEQVGGAARCLDEATAYGKIREQFGRPIGSFQAIKHMLADVLLDNECAAAAAEYATWTADHQSEQVPSAAASAKACASDAFLSAAGVNIQVHGGIGFTWEHDAHLFFRRATSSKEFLGSPELHRERLAASIFTTCL